MTKPPVAPVVFEPEFVQALTELFEKKVVFNQLLGLKITSIQPDLATARIAMRNELVGSYTHNRLHGGVISAVLDTVGGLAAITTLCARHMDEPPHKRIERFARLATIDLRVDYLRPGIGDWFDARAEVLRLGSRVASTRMEFRGADGTLLSTAAAAYVVS
jgi:uncharacterized protein (TIGR00369 family)